MRCPRCGYSLATGAQSCSRCGADLTPAARRRAFAHTLALVVVAIAVVALVTYAVLAWHDLQHGVAPPLP